MLTTYDENGGYPHPDHIRCHEVSMAAYEAAGDYRLYPDAGEPWSVSKLYYNHGFLRKRMQLFQDEFAKNGQVGPFEKWLKDWDPELDVTAEPDHHQRRVREVLRHSATTPCARTPPRSTRRASSSPRRMEWQQRLWPTEEYELARSRVPVKLPEDDLFAGIDP